MSGGRQICFVLVLVLAACAKPQNASVDGNDAGQLSLLALEDMSLPYIPPTRIVASSVSLGDKEGCQFNAPLRVFTDSLQFSIEGGDHVLRAKGSNEGTAVIGILAPATSEQVGMDGSGDQLLVIDELVVGRGGASTKYGRLARLVSIHTESGGVRLSARPGDHSVCPDPMQSVSARAQKIVEDESRHRALWLTSVDSMEAYANAVRLAQNPSPSEGEVASVYGEIEKNTGAVIGNLAIGRTVETSNGWNSAYAATSSGTNYDNCKPTGDHWLECSNGARVDLETLLPKKRPFSIFGMAPERYIRLRIQSEPTAANILVGAVRQGAVTNTALDVRAGDLTSLRLEKTGYQPCLYGSRWIARVLPGPRPVVEATCKLQRSGTARKRN